MASWSEKFGLLFQKHKNKLEASVTRRSVPGASTADLAMDAFTRIYAAGPRATSDDQVRMLYVVDRNAAYDAHRHNQVVVASADTMASLYGALISVIPRDTRPRAKRSRSSIGLFRP